MTMDATDRTPDEEHSESSDTTTKPAGVVLAIDVGSSSVRCTAYDCLATTHRRGHETVATVPIPGCFASIQRPGVEPLSGAVRTIDLMDAIDGSVDGVLTKLGKHFEGRKRGFRVEAVGFSTFVMNLVAVDANGKLVTFGDGDDDDDDQKGDSNSNEDAEAVHHGTPSTTVSISYACNATRVNEECRRLRRELGQEAVDKLYEGTGAPLHSAYALPQLRVLYNSLCPERKRKIHSWQSVAGYCLSQWTGTPHLPVSYSEASWTGLLNVSDCTYDESAVGLLPPECRRALPQLADFTDGLCGLPRLVRGRSEGTANPYWEKWPDLRDARFFLGIGDGACANVGSKCTGSSRFAVTIGTSAAARVCLRREAGGGPAFFSIPECRGLFCYRVDRHHVLIGGALTDGGSVVEWASRFLNLDPRAFRECLGEAGALVEAECEREARSAGRHREQGDLFVAPFLGGERSTGYRDGATGAVLGLTRETTPAHFLKASLEGVSLRLKAVLDLLLRLVREGPAGPLGIAGDPVIVASGRAMEANHLWRQMVSDASGLSVVLDEDAAEGTSRGLARLVALSLQRDAGSEETPLPVSEHEEDLNPYLTSRPTPAATALYARKFRAQEVFIDCVSPLFSSA